MLDRTVTKIGTAISLRAGDLWDALARTRHATCREHTRYYLAGVYVHASADGETLNFVATDGYRLAHVRVPVSPPVQFAPVLLKTDFVSEVCKFLGRKSDHMRSVTMTVSPRWLAVTNWKGERIETEPVDCTYPDYARTVPCQPPTRAVLAKQDLLAALEPIAGFLKPTKQRAVKLAVAGNSLTLSASIRANSPCELVATAQTVATLARPADQPYETGFNAEYLLEALKTFSDARRGSVAVVSICGDGIGSPHVLGCDSHETYVLMPMRV